ncbi:hypothetical protein [Stappia sp.]|uniref:hypothetical protein n=1 Tax=Stappia sp. TaxID=1870903 RepID=UPI0025F23F1E|nr:hypothetical protein [Stappia sp.]
MRPPDARPIARRTVALAVTLALGAGGLATMPGQARADSCWVHNGSLMRLKAEGNRRWFFYEEPRETLRRAGVVPGTLLFDGVKQGNWYSGTSRVFSRFCAEDELPYAVEGPVRPDQLQVTLSGTREVQDRCQPTGRTTTDTLVFTYSHRC